MIRRRLIIEWNDDGTDTDAECAKAFVEGHWGIDDLTAINDLENTKGVSVSYPIDLNVWVEDAPSAKGAVLSVQGAKVKELTESLACYVSSEDIESSRRAFLYNLIDRIKDDLTPKDIS